MRRTLILLAALALLLVCFIPGAGADPAMRPFKAAAGDTTQVMGPVGTDVCPPGDPYGPPEGGIGVSGTSSGVASHLGRFTATNFHCGSLAIPHGHLTLVAANGDGLFVDYGPCPLQDPPGPPPYADGQKITVNCPFSISGGTGRFEHATGGGTWTVQMVWPSMEGTWLMSGRIGY